MTLRKFLSELRKTPRKWEIWDWPNACRAITISAGSRPLTFICARIDKRQGGDGLEYGLTDWDLAAQELGIDKELAEKIQDASDFPMKRLNTPEKRKIRSKLLRAAGLYKRK